MNVEALAEQIALAAEAEVVALQIEVRKLRAQKEAIAAKNALLVAEKNAIELRLSAQILSIHANYLDRITALEKSLNNTNNVVAGLPSRDELEAVEAKLKQVGSDYYAHSARSNC